MMGHLEIIARQNACVRRALNSQEWDDEEKAKVPPPGDQIFINNVKISKKKGGEKVPQQEGVPA